MKKLSEPRLKVLRILHASGECASREVSDRLWPDVIHRKWLPGRAARMLYAMKKDGLVSIRYTDIGSNVRWSIASHGTKELELADAAGGA